MSSQVKEQAMSFEEIGAALGISKRTVKNTFHAGMKKLRKAELTLLIEYVTQVRALADRIEESRGYEE